MMSKEEELARLRAGRVAHLDSLIADLDHDAARAPKLGFLALLSIPIAFWKGIGWAFVEVVFVGCFIAVVFYILGGRREEYGREREDILRDAERALATRASVPTNAPDVTDDATAR